MTTRAHTPNQAAQGAGFPLRRRRILAAAVVAASALPVRAATDTWIGGTGSWSTGSNWSFGIAPSSGDSAALVRSDAIDRVITVNVSVPTLGLGGLTLDATGTGSMVLSQSANNFVVSGADEYIGYSGSGKVIQDGGSHAVTNGYSLRLGYNPGSNGTYSLSGTGYLSLGGPEYVGYKGNGSFIQSGSAKVLAGEIDIGFTAGSSGSYALSGGTVSASRVNVGGGTAGAGGTGSLTISGTSTLTTSGTLKIWNTLGTGVNFNGGTLSVAALDTSGNPGCFVWTAGTLSLAGALIPAFNNLGTNPTLATNQTLAIASSLSLPSGTSLSINGGAVTASPVSVNGGSLNLSSGNLSSKGNEFVGLSANGNVTQSGGTNVTTNSGNMYLGYNAGTSGSYTISGGVVRASNIYVGGNDSAPGGTGHVTISGGTFGTASSSVLKIWPSLGSGVILDSGTLSAGTLDNSGNTDGFAWNSGTVEITGSGGLIPSLTNIGTDITLAAGRSLSVTNTLRLPVGTSIALSGGKLSVGAFDVSGNPGGFTWTSGTLAFIGNSGFTPSSNNIGTNPVITTGKTLAVTRNVTLSNGTSLSINGGSLSMTSLFVENSTVSLSDANSHVSGTTYVGNQAGGTFTQTDGICDSNIVYLGYYTGGTGTYSLSGGGLIGQGEYIGYNGVGTFNQTGGTNTTEALDLGYYSSSSGSYVLSAGTLNNTRVEFIALNGIGSFVQTGGTHTIGDNLYLGSASTATGTYVLSGGNASAANIIVGSQNGGYGTVTISGTGSLSVTGTLTIWNDHSHVSLSGGTLSVGTLSTSGNPARFSWTAGTLSITGAPADISSAGPFGSFLRLFPGKILRTTALPTIAPTASLDISGGSLVVAYSGPSPADQLRSALQSGRIFSSAANNDPLHHLAVGYTDSASTLNVSLTTLGDANLDGVLNADDYALLDRSFAMHLSNAHWTDGDFNYDGVINSSDYLLIDTTLASQSPLSPAFLAERESRFGDAYVQSLLASVPEPTAAFALPAAAALSLLRRRRRDCVEFRRTRFSPR